MVHGTIVLIIKPLSFMVCYSGFYSGWNHAGKLSELDEKYKAEPIYFAPAFSPNGQRVYNGKVIG